MATGIQRLDAPMAAAEVCARARAAGRRVGFVPTMGALHAGHLELVARARAECDLAVVSVFVNPLQFDDPADLARYPRDLEGDARQLAGVGCDLVFTGELLGERGFFPEVRTAAEVPVESPGPAAAGLEGACREGHFEGVATIVRRLFELVRPDRAYFGAKDYQQTLVVRDLAARLAADLGGLELVVCPTSRDPDGLARSSRNARLSVASRAAALAIPRALGAARTAWDAGLRDAGLLRAVLEGGLASTLGEGPPLEVEYAALRDPEAWTAAEPDGALERAVALVAVRVPADPARPEAGTVRLIDNRRLDGEPA